MANEPNGGPGPSEAVARADAILSAMRANDQTFGELVEELIRDRDAEALTAAYERCADDEEAMLLRDAVGTVACTQEAEGPEGEPGRVVLFAVPALCELEHLGAFDPGAVADALQRHELAGQGLAVAVATDWITLQEMIDREPFGFRDMLHELLTGEVTAEPDRALDSGEITLGVRFVVGLIGGGIGEEDDLDDPNHPEHAFTVGEQDPRWQAWEAELRQLAPGIRMVRPAALAYAALSEGIELSWEAMLMLLFARAEMRAGTRDLATHLHVREDGVQIALARRTDGRVVEETFWPADDILVDTEWLADMLDRLSPEMRVHDRAETMPRAAGG